jgi:hypothetical protein
MVRRNKWHVLNVGKQDIMRINIIQIYYFDDSDDY